MGKLYAYQGTCVGVRGHLYETGSLLPPLCGFQGFFQGSQVCIASSLSTKPIPSIQQILFLLQVVVIHQLPTFFLGVGSLCIASIKHGCGAGGSVLEPTNPGHTSDGDPRGDNKSRGFPRPNAEDYISCSKSVIIGHKGQYHGCHQGKS